jgi:hypothetical protein
LQSLHAKRDAGQVPVPTLWDDQPTLPWSQLRRKLRDDPEVRSVLRAALDGHPATAGRLVGLRTFRTSEAHPSDSTWFAGTWAPENTEVLVKINVTPRERFWMTTASQRTTGIVPRVFAGDAALAGADISWLVLERIPYSHEPAWGAAAHTALLRAAARFQVFAAAVDTRLVYEEGIETIRGWSLGGQDLCPEAAAVLANLDRDWAWVTAVAPPEVMFGDLHVGNAAFTGPPSDPQATALLFDPIPRRQPWPFEPAYLEILCGGQGLVSAMAAIRKAQGRPAGTDQETGRLGTLYCAWMALLSWGILPHLRSDAGRRARLTDYVRAAAQLH